MLSILYLLFFLLGGCHLSHFLLGKMRVSVRIFVGLVIGTVFMMWFPALWAALFTFGVKAHLFAAGTMLALCGAVYFFFRLEPVNALTPEEKKDLPLLLLTVLPLFLLSMYLEYTHTLREAADGSLWVGQSTYGDLQLHLSIASSAINAKFPLQNSLLVGETLRYPPLSDTFASTFCVFGMSLTNAMLVSAGVLLFLCYTGCALLYLQLCKKRSAAVLAFFLLFMNGGLGFFYTLDSAGGTSLLENLQTVMTGYYKTPTNQPDPYNLRWVNLICDMLVPQRSFLGGWAVLMGILNILLPDVTRGEKFDDPRRSVITGVLAGLLPMIHTHSYVALALACAAMCCYHTFKAPEDETLERFKMWGLFAAIAAALSIPQLFGFTFKQTGSSDHFLSFHFNWCNNRSKNGLVDPYLWFYLKNIGVPYLLILFGLMQRKPRDLARLPDDLYRNRILGIGAFFIYIMAELIQFQPNEYDNNKLFYVWFLLCLPIAGDTAVDWFGRLKGVTARVLIAAVFIILCFTSSTLTVARECVSNYQVYTANDVAAAEFVKEETPEHCVILTGTQHLNPVSALAGRTLVCGPDLYLYWHGYSTDERQEAVEIMYTMPETSRALIDQYGVSYIWVSAYERSAYDVDTDVLDSLYEKIYDEGGITIYAVGEAP